MKPKLTRDQALKLAQKHNIPIPPQEDTFAQGLIGAPTGVASMFDIPGELYNLTATGIEKVGKKLGYNPELPRINPNATLAAREITNMIAGEPETEAQAKGRAGGEFLGGFIGPAKTRISPIETAKDIGKVATKTTSTLAGVNPSKYEAFEKAGISPTLGEISNNPIAPMVQKGLENFPGSAHVFHNKIATREEQLNQLFNKVGEVDKALALEKTGKLTEKGGKAYNTKAKDIAEKLYNRAWKGIDDYAEVPLYKTREAIANELSAITPEARKILKESTGGKALEKLQYAIINNGGKLPFGDLKKVFKKDLSDLVDTWGQVGTSEQGKIKNIINTLDSEMGDFIKKTNPKATKDLEKADKFWSQYSERNRDIANLASKEADPIKIFNSTLSKLKSGDTQPFKVLTQRLEPAEKQLFSSTAVNEIGSGKNGIFDANKFSKEFNKLRPESQEVLLSGFSKSDAGKIKDVSIALEHARIASNTGNTSKTAYYSALAAWVTNLIYNPASTLGAAAGARVGAEIFTNPTVLDALYKASKTKTADGVNKVMNRYLPDITAQMSRMEALKQPQNEKPKLTKEKAQQLLMQMEQSR